MHHHKRDWNQYNKELINRGKIDFWIPHDVCWQAPWCKKNGRPFVYTDEDQGHALYPTTGLKVYGAGEWRAKRYGGKARWIKIHRAMDLKSKKLVLAEASPEHQHDTTYLREVLKRINRRKVKVRIDGIGDSQKCYELAEKHHKELITPPKQGAILKKKGVIKKGMKQLKPSEG